MIITDKNVIVLITSYYINYLCIIITIQETRWEMHYKIQGTTHLSFIGVGSIFFIVGTWLISIGTLVLDYLFDCTLHI